MSVPVIVARFRRWTYRGKLRPWIRSRNVDSAMSDRNANSFMLHPFSCRNWSSLEDRPRFRSEQNGFRINDGGLLMSSYIKHRISCHLRFAIFLSLVVQMCVIVIIPHIFCSFETACASVGLLKLYQFIHGAMVLAMQNFVSMMIIELERKYVIMPSHLVARTRFVNLRRIEATQNENKTTSIFKQVIWFNGLSCDKKCLD